MDKPDLIFRGKPIWVEFGWLRPFSEFEVCFVANPDFVDEEGDEYFIHVLYEPGTDHPFIFDRWYEYDTTVEESLTPEEIDSLTRYAKTLADESRKYMEV